MPVLIWIYCLSCICCRMALYLIQGPLDHCVGYDQRHDAWGEITALTLPFIEFFIICFDDMFFFFYLVIWIVPDVTVWLEIFTLSSDTTCYWWYMHHMIYCISMEYIDYYTMHDAFMHNSIAQGWLLMDKRYWVAMTNGKQRSL